MERIDEQDREYALREQQRRDRDREYLREKLETAWLRGYQASITGSVLGNERETAAAGYAERVVEEPER